MKPTRQYTCTRRINKEGEKIWVVLENGRKFYRIFRTQTQAIEYFQPLKTPAEMMVQQAKGNLFVKTVYTKMEMERRGFKNSSKAITTRKVVKDSDKIFEEEKITKQEPKKVTKQEPKKVTKSKPKKVVKTKEVIKEIEVIKYIDSNTGEIVTDEEIRNRKKKIINKPLFIEEEIVEDAILVNDKTDLIFELNELDKERVVEFEKKDTLNISIIDEILSRKSMVENSWNESYTQPDMEIEKIEDTIYVKEEIEKPIIINSKKIEFNDESLEKTSTIENIIEQRTEEINVKSVDYGRIKEHTDYEKTQIQNFQNVVVDEKKEDSSLIVKKSSNTKFWVLTVLISLLLIGLAILIVLILNY